MLGLLQPNAGIWTTGGVCRDGAEKERGPHGYRDSRTKRQPHGAHGLRPRGWRRDPNRVQLLAKPYAERTFKRAVESVHTHTDA